MAFTYSSISNIPDIITHIPVQNNSSSTEVALSGSMDVVGTSDIHLQTLDQDASPDRIHIMMAHVYFWATGCMSIASIFGSIVIGLTYWMFPELRTSGRKLLVFLSIADFLTAFGNIMGISWYIFKDDMTETSGDILCKFHASLTIFSSISSFLWTGVIAVHLYLCIVQGKTKLAKTLIFYFHMLCWIIPGKGRVFYGIWN